MNLFFVVKFLRMSGPEYNINDYPVLLFDTQCLICNGFVQWIIKRDRRKLFKFSGLQSDKAYIEIRRRQLLIPKNGTVVLLYPDQAYTQSEAVLQVLHLIRFPPFLIRIFRSIPRTWRDRIYSVVARNRYGFFSQKTSCPLPPPEEAWRFI